LATNAAFPAANDGHQVAVVLSAMPRRLYLLPFDHRETFARKLFGWKGSLNVEQAAEITAAKQLIYDGFQEAVANGVPKESAAILADERFSASILRDASEKGYLTACPAERSGQREFMLEYGPDFAHHIERINPTYCKVLVRYNPQGDAGMNLRQATRLQRLSDYLRRNGRLFMFELLVPAEPSQLASVGGSQDAYDSQLRPTLMFQAIHQLQASGVEPDVWKIEGIDRRDDCANVVAAVRRGGRDKVTCIVLGRGADADRVRAWLATAATVPGFVGFAVGRTTFWDALVEWRAQRITRAAAVEIIAHRYQEWVDIFERQALQDRETERLARRAIARWENEGGRT
jgi:5-dehydro-2-deoxygluconokinase